MIFPLNILFFKNNIIFLVGVEKKSPTITFSANAVKYKENEILEEQMSTNADDEIETDDESTIINLFKEFLGHLSKRFKLAFLTTLYPLSICSSVNMCFHPFVNMTSLKLLGKFKPNRTKPSLLTGIIQ